MTVTFSDRGTVTAKPEAILHLMQTARDIRRGVETPPLNEYNGDEYLCELVEYYNERGIRLDVKGETFSERCESILREMARHNIIEIKEESEWL